MVLLGNLCGMLPEPLYARNYTKEQEVTARAKVKLRSHCLNVTVTTDLSETPRCRPILQYKRVNLAHLVLESRNQPLMK